jgi:glycosyltransferase involved in cell wall biosynthesis
LRPDLYFLIPGDLNTLTGGYAYDRELIAALHTQGITVQHIALSASYPAPDHEAESETARLMAAIPDGALVLIDGLAYGVMDKLVCSEHHRLTIIALCHHPLAFESGLDTHQQSTLFKSEKAALDMASAIVVTSAATARLLTSAFDIAVEKITVALPGTQQQRFAACQGNPPRLLTVATLIQRKAHDVLIDALSRLSYLPWTARFVGGDQFDPDWANYLKQSAETLGLAERISFVGSVADLNTEYANADVFVLPSRFEGYGMVFAEALAYGLPIIAAHAGAVPDVVPDSAGILVPPNDATRLAFAIQNILTEPAHYQALRLGAQQAATQLPDWQHSAAQVAELLSALNIKRQH